MISIGSLKKLCKEDPEEVVIEFINYESFKIIFCLLNG